MLSSSQSFDDGTVDTGTFSQSPDGDDTSPDEGNINSENTNTNIVHSPAFSYAIPFPLSPTFSYQSRSKSTEPFTIKHIFRETGLHDPSDSTFRGNESSANVSFGGSELVNSALRDDVLAASCAREEKTSSTSIPPPNGIFTLFGSPIFPSLPGFNFHSGGFNFPGNPDLLPPFFNPNLQPNPGPPTPTLLTSIYNNSEVLLSIFHFTDPITSASRFPEPLCSGPRFLRSFTSSSHYSVPRFPDEPSVSAPHLAVGICSRASPPASHLPLPSCSRLPEPGALVSSSRMSSGSSLPDPKALASGSRVPYDFHLPELEVLASCSPMPEIDSSPPSFLLPEPEESPSGSSSDGTSRRGKRPLIDNAAERRRVRKDKNRASAARSRERLRAYTTELEREVDYLTEANEQLRRKTALMWLDSAKQDNRKRWFGRAASPPF